METEMTESNPAKYIPQDLLETVIKSLMWLVNDSQDSIALQAAIAMLDLVRVEDEHKAVAVTTLVWLAERGSSSAIRLSATISLGSLL